MAGRLVLGPVDAEGAVTGREVKDQLGGLRPAGAKLRILRGSREIQDDEVLAPCDGGVASLSMLVVRSNRSILARHSARSVEELIGRYMVEPGRAGPPARE
mmetsp:Transcript_86004/g.243986  ORF Transcript_86004/g.243986 Transcript_86004/m.243986 type:complete len:101 (-) Transcript_86004:247-549(-)